MSMSLPTMNDKNKAGKAKVVHVPPLKSLIKPSPGFEKKKLSEFKLDLMALCMFACIYCSSNWGNYLRINRERFADLTEQQLGERIYPGEDPDLTFVWPDVIAQLENELAGKRPGFGAGKTLVVSMLTDAFSPLLIKDGTTRRALELLVEHTEFRIRILTKNAVVGNRNWIEFFTQHRDRFVVGLSTGTVDDEWAKRVEIGTSLPSARLRALRNLQDAGIATYAMLCPTFPDMLIDDKLDELIDAVRPQFIENFWAEPYNDRKNWRVVRDSYPKDSEAYTWLTEVYEQRSVEQWSRYATDLHLRIRQRAEDEGWLGKLRYLLYEDMITEQDASSIEWLEGILLQSKPREDGLSRNPAMRRLQET